MSQYQSISMSLDGDQDWEVPIYKNDVDAKQQSPRTTDIYIESTLHKEGISRTDIQVCPIEEGYKSKCERDTLLENYVQDYSSNNPKAKNNNTFWPWSFIVMTTLCMGFCVGFSFGYYASEYRHLSARSTYHDERSEMPLNPLKNNPIENDAKKVFQFMDEFLFRDSPLLAKGEKQGKQDPPLRLSFQQTTTKKPITYLSGIDAYSYLLDTSTIIPTISQYSNDFFLISSGLDSQINQAYCGVATVVAILNSLRFIKTTDEDDGVDVPVDPNFDPYPYATQIDIFNNCTRQTVISHTGGGPGVDGILTPPYGLNMDQVSKLLQCHLQSTKTYEWKVSIQYVDNTHQTVGKMKFDLKNALFDPNSRVLVNYDRETVGQVGGGHWSPVGSYSDSIDAFLILDVAKYKYPPVWIQSERLFDAMSTQDECGQWNFPSGQDVLSQEERFAHTPVDYATSKTKLQCQSKLRGYIIVSRS